MCDSCVFSVEVVLGNFFFSGDCVVRLVTCLEFDYVCSEVR